MFLILEPDTSRQTRHCVELPVVEIMGCGGCRDCTGLGSGRNGYADTILCETLSMIRSVSRPKNQSRVLEIPENCLGGSKAR